MLNTPTQMPSGCSRKQPSWSLTVWRLPYPRRPPHYSLRAPTLSGPSKQLCTNEAGNKLDREPPPHFLNPGEASRGEVECSPRRPLSPVLSGSILPSSQRHSVYLLTGSSLVPGCLAPLWAGILFSNCYSSTSLHKNLEMAK